MDRNNKLIAITKAIQEAVPELRIAQYGSTVHDKDLGTGTVLDYITRSESIGRGFCKARVCWHSQALVHNEVIDELGEDEDFPLVVPKIGIREILLWIETKHTKEFYFFVHSNHPFGDIGFYKGNLVLHFQINRAPASINVPYNLHEDSLEDQDDELINFLFTFTQS